MSVLVVALRILLGFSLLAYAAYTGMSVWAARLWARTRRPPNSEWIPPVTILKPVCGVDAEAYQNFASFCQLDYPPDRLQIIFGALDSADPALALVRRLQSDFPEVDITVLSEPTHAPNGLNRKVCNLAMMLPYACHELLILCDSDMRVTPDYVRRVVAPFQPAESSAPTSSSLRSPSSTSRVGLVTCPYTALHAHGIAAVLEALGIGADFIPGALVSRALEGVGFALGSTIALPRRVLKEIGGFEVLRDELADDFRLGEGVRKAGYEVVLSEYVIADVLGKENWRAAWSRRLRWARTMRACRPAGYAGAFVTHGLALSLLFLLAYGFTLLGWATVGMVLGIRFLTTLWITQRYTRDRNILRFLPLLPLSDLLAFALFIFSFCGNQILWRGERFRLLPGGKLAVHNRHN